MPLLDISMNNQEPDPPLPRKPEDASQIHRLRREALEHLDAEEHPSPGAVYGGPAPVYGGSPFGGGSVSRRWTLKRIFIILFGLIAAALAALFFGRHPGPGPGNVIYGGPPPRPDPGPGNPVYGGPVPPPPGPDDKLKKRKPSARKRAAPKPPSEPPPAAAVYGGPAPQPPQPQTPTEPPQ